MLALEEKYRNGPAAPNDEGDYNFNPRNCERAIADYNRALERDPNYALAYYNRGYCYETLGDSEKAEADFARALELEPNLAEIYISRGDRYFASLQSYKYKMAEVEYTKAARISPQGARIYSKLGLAIYHAATMPEHYTKALEILNRALELDPNFAEAYHNRGLVYYYHFKDYDRAFSNFNKVIELDPTNANFYFQRGIFYFRLEDYAHAASDFEKATEFDPTNLDFYYHCGKAYAKSGNFDRAVENFAKILELNPKSWILEINDRELKDWLEIARHVAENPSDTAGLYKKYGAAYFEQKDYDRAIESYSKAIEFNPNAADAYEKRGTAYNNLNDNERALADFNRALELDPSNDEFYRSRAFAYLYCEEYARATADIHKVVALAPHKFNIVFKADYERALELTPNNRLAQESCARLRKLLGRE